MGTNAPADPAPGTIVSLIAAVAANRVIGREGVLPWRIPDDTARFKRLTMGHPLIMGRVTFRSLGRVLPGRTSIVLTRDRSAQIPGAVMAHSAEEALRAAAAAPGGAEAFVIGGAEVYALFLPVARRMYLTWVDEEAAGDAVFPAVAWDQWQVVRETPAPATGGVPPHRFLDYARKDP